MTTTLIAPAPIRVAPGIRTIRVALAGCGTVGGSLVELIEHSRAEVAARYGVGFEIVRVLVRDAARERPAALRDGIVTTDLEHFLAADADLVVEALGGIEPALRIAEAALDAGRRLVTANKALVAAHGPALVRRAEQSGGRLDFESAVAGGIPVLRALRDQLAATGIESVRGVLNGTVNYILTRLGEGASYADALAEAQRLGFAEADPSRDVSGEDAAEKARILAWLAFGADPAELPVRRRGIVPHSDRLAADAAALGRVARLVAECVRTDAGVSATVEPVFVPAGSELAGVRGADNAVLIRSRWNGALRLAGPGAGGGPTASAVLADMLRSAHPLRLPAGAGAGVEESAPHRWSVSVSGGEGAVARLERALARAGAAAESVASEHNVVRAVIAPVPWPRLHLAVRALEGAGAAPVVARLADADA
jgi:homoserine dehydrogenase